MLVSPGCEPDTTAFHMSSDARAGPIKSASSSSQHLSAFEVNVFGTNAVSMSLVSRSFELHVKVRSTLGKISRATKDIVLGVRPFHFTRPDTSALLKAQAH